MRVDIQYFKIFCKGKYIEKELQAEEENLGFKIEGNGLKRAHQNCFALQPTEKEWMEWSLTFEIR